MRLINIAVSWFLWVQLTLCFTNEALQLTELSLASDNNIIELLDGDLSMVDGPRDYYTVLIFTSSDIAHGCQPCTEAYEIISRVSKSWFADHAESNYLAFINIDLINQPNSKIFQILGLQTIPHIWLIPPNSEVEYGRGPYKILEEPHLDFRVPKGSKDEQVLEFAQFISENTQRNIMVRDEEPIMKFLKTFLITFSVIIIIKKRGPSIITSSKKKTVTGIFFICLLLMSIGGYQFTVQQGVPFIAKNDKGGIIFVSGGRHYQFGIEVVVSAITYASLASALLFLIYIGKYEITDKSIIKSEIAKAGLVLLSAGIEYLLYSCLTSIILRKDPGYPYGFTKLF
ncbi:Dolichyl-diphosphooligosaccharide--protein glycosyltransferase subunit OST6 [Spathaspora sp. JA1]|nr:Dolichyl-diphosphooligosaccharide--protein glycosyltransferase subunit OST6 [Spathaspora sp. JA1]